MNPNNINNMIDSLRNFELTVALLYDTYAETFNTDQGAWLALAEEERMHARWLAGLKLYHQNQMVSLNETKVTIQSINKAIEFLQEQVDKARNSKINAGDAVRTALQIEDSILENSFLKIFRFNTPKAKEVRQKLIWGTINHRNTFTRWLAGIEQRPRIMAAQ